VGSKATPVQAFVNSLQGKWLGNAQLPAGYGSIPIKAHGFIGAAHGYATLDAAVKRGQAEAAKWLDTEAFKSVGVAVFEVGDRYALTYTNRPVFFADLDQNAFVKPLGYRTSQSTAAQALAGVIDGDGTVLKHLGSAHWWNRLGF
jgi:hypothetical protein